MLWHHLAPKCLIVLDLCREDARERVVELGGETQLSTGGPRALHIYTEKLLGVTQLYVRGIAIDRDDEIAVEVTPAWRKPRCARCGTRAAQYDHPPSVGRWQDLNWGPIRIYLVYRCRRVTCARCGGKPRNALVPWAAAGTKFTHRMEELAAFLARQTDITSVTSILGMG